MPEISAPRPQMVRYEANRGAATLHSEAGSGAGADRFISGVKGEVSAEVFGFPLCFFKQI